MSSMYVMESPYATVELKTTPNHIPENINAYQMTLDIPFLNFRHTETVFTEFEHRARKKALSMANDITLDISAKIMDIMTDIATATSKENQNHD